MKLLLILLTLCLLASFTSIVACKMMNPIANANIEVPWDFPALAILSGAAYAILENQENILYHLKNK